MNDKTVRECLTEVWRTAMQRPRARDCCVHLDMLSHRELMSDPGTHLSADHYPESGTWRGMGMRTQYLETRPMPSVADLDISLEESQAIPEEERYGPRLIAISYVNRDTGRTHWIDHERTDPRWAQL